MPRGKDMIAIATNDPSGSPVVEASEASHLRKFGGFRIAPRAQWADASLRDADLTRSVREGK
ncbi:MAG: hypothetical protein K9G75_03680 [Candidatus Nanopelagicales bacterium]|nr:hypothetical protein [Candidatus Nanopelagicales bacterium]